MSTLSSRLAKLEQAAGVGVPCEACALERSFDARLDELSRAWHIPPPSRSRLIRVSCSWCAARVDYPAEGFTPEEVAAFERCDALMARGEVCLPEFVRLREVTAAAGEGRETSILHSSRANPSHNILYSKLYFRHVSRYHAG